MLTRCCLEVLADEVIFICCLILFAGNFCFPVHPSAGVQAEPQVKHNSFGAAVASKPGESSGSIIRPLPAGESRSPGGISRRCWVEFFVASAFSASDTRWRWKSPFPPELRALECEVTTRVCPRAWKDEIFLFNPK